MTAVHHGRNHIPLCGGHLSGSCALSRANGLGCLLPPGSPRELCIKPLALAHAELTRTEGRARRRERERQAIMSKRDAIREVNQVRGGGLLLGVGGVTEEQWKRDVAAGRKRKLELGPSDAPVDPTRAAEPEEVAEEAEVPRRDAEVRPVLRRHVPARIDRSMDVEVAARLPGTLWRSQARFGAAGTPVEQRRTSPIVELSMLLVECVQHGLRTIAFCKTRKLCELVRTKRLDLDASRPEPRPTAVSRSKRR